MTKQESSAARSVNNSESRKCIAVGAAVLQVGASRFSFERPFQLFDKIGLRFLVNLNQHSALLILATLFRGTFLGARKGNSAFFGNDAHGFRKRALLHFHDEFKDVAALAAAETVVNLLCRMNVERRGFLRMEWAEPAKILAGLFQLDVFTDHADDIRLLLDFLRQ